MNKLIVTLGLIASSHVFAAEDCIDLRMNGKLAGVYSVTEHYSGQPMERGTVEIKKALNSLGYSASGRALGGERKMDISVDPENSDSCSFGILTPLTGGWDFYTLTLSADGAFTLASFTDPRSLTFSRMK